MKRIPLPLGRRLFVAVALLAALVLLTPARLLAGWLGLDAQGLAARELSGAIWAARAVDVQFAGLPLGTVEAGLHPLPLLAGRARIGFKAADNARGVISFSRHRIGLEADRLRLPAAGRFAPLPVLAVILDGASVRYRDGLCETAEGSARIELAAEVSAQGLPGTLAGPIRCDAGELVLPLASTSGRERLTVRLRRGGRYRAELMIRADDPAVGAQLARAGFSPRGGGYALDIEGAW